MPDNKPTLSKAAEGSAKPTTPADKLTAAEAEAKRTAGPTEAEATGTTPTGPTGKAEPNKPLSQPLSDDNNRGEAPNDPGPVESLLNEPVEDQFGRKRNLKQEEIGAVGELDPHRRTPDQKLADEQAEAAAKLAARREGGKAPAKKSAAA